MLYDGIGHGNGIRCPMPKKAAGLTARRVQTALAVDRPLMLADGRGLYLRLTPGGAKSWVFRYQLHGKRRDMGLGSADLFSLAEARQKAFAAKRLVAEKIDPLERRKAQVVAADIKAAKAITFRQCAEAYIASRKWKNPK